MNERSDSANRLSTPGLLLPQRDKVRDLQTGKDRGNKGETEGDNKGKGTDIKYRN